MSAYSLNFVRVFTRDLKRAHDFYTSTLGMTATQSNFKEGYVLLATNGATLILEERDGQDSHANLVGRFSGISFTVRDIEAMYNALELKGVKFLTPPEKQSWGGYLAHFRDPDGNTLTLAGR